MDLLTDVLAPLALISLIASFGATSTFYYDGDANKKMIHPVRFVQGLIAYGLALLPAMAWYQVLACAYVGLPIFQGLIHLDYGWRFFSKREKWYWMLGPIKVPKITLWGRLRVLSIIIGLAVLTYVAVQ